MIEVIRHTLGLCGEPHISVMTAIPASASILAAVGYVKVKLSKKN